MTIRAFTVRLYPTKEQEISFIRHIGCSRFIYNYMLELQNKNYKDGNKFISRFDMIKLLTPLKKQENYFWLNGVSNKTLQISCTDLSYAFKRFFNKISRYPKFRSKKLAKEAFPISSEQLYFENNTVLNIQKVGKVRYKCDKQFIYGKNKCKYTNPRVSSRNGKWILTFGMECENQTPTLSNDSMGIDLGIKELAVVAFGNQKFVFHNINKSKKMRSLEDRIKHVQRSMARKYSLNKKSTNNSERDRVKLKGLYAKQTNIRNNNLHQITHKLITMNPKRVVMEDLNVSGMMKNKHLSKAIQEQKFYEFIRQMKYKSEWNSIEFIQADRFYPSSKTCSDCGTIKKELKLSDRTYRCPVCGLEIDRDYNAAINLMKYNV